MHILTVGRKRLAAATAIVILVGNGARAQETPEQIVAGWLGQATAFPFVQVETANVAHDAETGVTTISDLHISATIGPDTFDLPAASTGDQMESLVYDIRFPKVSFTGLRSDAKDYRADAIRVGGGTALMEVKSDNGDDFAATTQISDYVIRDMRWSRFPEIAEDSAHPVSRFYPLAEALLDFDFSGADIGPIVTVTHLPDGVGRQTTIYGPQQYGRAVRGDIESVAIDLFSMSVHGADEAGNPLDIRMHAGPLTAEGYNYGTLVRSFAPDAVAPAGGDRPYVPVFGAMHMPGLVVSGKAGAEDIAFEGGIGSFSVEDIGMRAPSIDILGKIDELAVAAQQPDATEPPEEDIITLVASIYGAFRLGLFEMTDMYFDVGDLASGEIGSIRLTDLSASGLGEFSEEGVDIRGPEGLMSKLDRMAIENVAFPPLDALMGLEAAQQAGDIAAVMRAIPTVGRILYSGLDVNVPGELEMQLNTGRIDMSDHIGPIPTSIDVEISGLRVPTEYMDSEPREQLRALGYDALDASIALSAAWNGASETAKLAGSGELVDGGTFTINAEIGGLKRLLFENPQAAAMQIALVTFNGANFRFEDNSLRDRVVRLVAAQQNTTPEMVEQMAMGMVPLMLAPLQRPELVGRAAEAIKGFFEGAGVLGVSAAPASPVPLLSIASGAQTDPGALVDSLNLAIDAQ